MSRKAFIALITAALAIAMAAPTASASRGVTTAGLLITASGNPTFTAGVGSTTCAVRLGLDLNETINKTVGSTIGTVLASPASTITNCSGIASRGAVLSGIVLRYVSFTGTLPNISSITGTANGQFSLDTIIGTCLYAGAVTVTMHATSGNVSAATISANGTLVSTGPGGLCSSLASPGSITNGGLTLSLNVGITLV